jgi:hypothetical protein
LANPIAQSIGGFFSGLLAGITGYMVDLGMGTAFQAFQPFNPFFLFYGLLYAFFSFVLGLMDAYYAGFFFSNGIISAGLLLSDSVTIISGVISTTGIVLGIAISLFYKNR